MPLQHLPLHLPTSLPVTKVLLLQDSHNAHPIFCWFAPPFPQPLMYPTLLYFHPTPPLHNKHPRLSKLGPPSYPSHPHKRHPKSTFHLPTTRGETPKWRTTTQLGATSNWSTTIKLGANSTQGTTIKVGLNSTWRETTRLGRSPNARNKLETYCWKPTIHHRTSLRKKCLGETPQPHDRPSNYYTPCDRATIPKNCKPTMGKNRSSTTNSPTF